MQTIQKRGYKKGVHDLCIRRLQDESIFVRASIRLTECVLWNDLLNTLRINRGCIPYTHITSWKEAVTHGEDDDYLRHVACKEGELHCDWIYRICNRCWRMCNRENINVTCQTLRAIKNFLYGTNDDGKTLSERRWKNVNGTMRFFHSVVEILNPR